jgi:hypothetical protein
MTNLPLLLALVPACTPGLSVEVLGDLRHQYGYAKSTSKGTAKVKVEVFEGDSALQFVADVAAPYQVHVRTVESPDQVQAFSSADWNDNPRSKTNAGFVSAVATLDWPVVPADVQLTPGVWRFELGVVDADQAYVAETVGIDVLSKVDPDFDSGRLTVNIVYTEGLDEDAEVRGAVEDAQRLWADLYQQIGIDVVFEQFSYDAEELGPPAFAEEERYEDIAAQTSLRGVNLVLSPRIQGLEQIFGIAGDIPGPLVPTRRSAVQVATVSAAGPDLRFSTEETRLLAETMAHETLHFLGLFHPVESTWAAWDVLGDTDECDSETRCRDELGDNLMFPYPVCNGETCRPQSFVSDEQGAVANRAVAVE